MVNIDRPPWVGLVRLTPHDLTNHIFPFLGHCIHEFFDVWVCGEGHVSVRGLVLLVVVVHAEGVGGIVVAFERQREGAGGIAVVGGPGRMERAACVGCLLLFPVALKEGCVATETPAQHGPHIYKLHI